MHLIFNLSATKEADWFENFQTLKTFQGDCVHTIYRLFNYNYEIPQLQRFFLYSYESPLAVESLDCTFVNLIFYFHMSVAKA